MNRGEAMHLGRREFVISSLAIAGGCATSESAIEPAPSVWRALPTEPYPGKQDDISFVSPDIGWYGNGAGKLYRTHDGGETWTKIWERPGTFIRALGFLNQRVGFLGNVGTNYFPNVTDTHPLYRTEDGGMTWTPIDAAGLDRVPGVCGIDIVRSRGATIIHAGGRVGGPAMLLRSLDAGATWRVIDLSAHAGMILDLKFFDADNGLVCASTSANITQGHALMLRTSDGGETWSRAYESTRTHENCWKMSFPTRRVGYASVQNYEEGATQRVIVKTTDGGATWRELPLVDDARVREFGVGFVNAHWGWVGASTTGFETRNGGETWVPIDMGRAVNKIRILRAGDRVRAFAIGAEVRRLDA
jgi:photosystem II stability/assembly factor-like uncharacterized protein